MTLDQSSSVVSTGPKSILALSLSTNNCITDHITQEILRSLDPIPLPSSPVSFSLSSSVQATHGSQNTAQSSQLSQEPQYEELAQQPPLLLLVYAARRILEPTLLIEHTPSLLTLLAHIDLFRQRAVAIVHHARKWDEFLSKTPLHGPLNIPLTNSEIRKLDTLVRKSESVRALYRGLVNRSVRLVRADYYIALRVTCGVREYKLKNLASICWYYGRALIRTSCLCIFACTSPSSIHLRKRIHCNYSMTMRQTRRRPTLSRLGRPASASFAMHEIGSWQELVQVRQLCAF
jgi:hypothetical protein